jgi:hypothetical protein
MKRRAKAWRQGMLIAGVTVAVLATAPAREARAQCCPGYSPATACAGMTLTKSRWCIQNTVPTGQKALPPEFCAYGDKVITTLESVFNIPAQGIFEFELDTQTGGAHTGTACNHVGNGTAYDAFAGSAYKATGFWGYLLSLHEAINDWTGMASTGWPTDWWADHQSAFPNLMDFHIMTKIGMDNNDPNLLMAATAQKGRFYPKGDSADAKVVALDNVFAAMPKGDGFAGFSHMFAMQSGDGVQWDGLGVNNPDVKRSEYVAAYMSLAAGQNVLKLLQGPGANGGGGICNNTADGSGDKPYTCDEGRVDAIATAHCAVAANGKRMADLTNLRKGNAASVPSGPCGSACPSECGCDGSQHCVARWLAAPGSADAGTTGSGGGAGTGGATGGGNTGGSGGGTGGSGDTGGSGGDTGGSSGGTGGSKGTGGSSSGSGGSSTGMGGSTETDDASSGGPGGHASATGGCNCHLAVGGTDRATGSVLLVAAALAAGRWRRRRARRC